MFQNPLIKIPFRYGLIGGVLGSIVIAVLYYLGRHPFLLPVIVDFRIVIFALLISFSLKEVRDYYFKGNLLFWQGMVGSYVLIVTSGLIGSFATLVLARVDADFVPQYVGKLQQQMAGYQKQIIESVGTEVYQQQLAKLPGTTAWDLAGDYFLKSLIIGLFLTIIISVILRKQTN
ncbi:MAG: DUF4199 domain-containing protein [Bacteroidetes bacterium]|nr:DUF4199 domain-containing protein [Bacteroidota bacterium]